MNIAVVGLWHLGSAYSACLAGAGHRVIAIDEDAQVIANLRVGRPPVAEPGLAELIVKELAGNHIEYTTDVSRVAQASVVWVTYDTPVDEEDRADAAFVLNRIGGLFPHLKDGTLAIVSSQLPAGTCRAVEAAFAAVSAGRTVYFACSPENLRLGSAIEVFLRPDRVVMGVRNARARELAAEALAPITDRIEWMSVESAEMTKHAINAFLATSVVFMNEIAALCEKLGADAGEVSRGLKSDARIGPKAYLRPGGAFAGGTLARDIAFLTQLADTCGLDGELFTAVGQSNQQQKSWTIRRLGDVLGSLPGRRVAVWGLTYKPGTDTLRRSSSVETCKALAAAGAKVSAHDPAIRQLPSDLAAVMSLAGSPAEALAGAEALLVLTQWPEYRQIAAADIVGRMARPVVLDPNGFLEKTLAGQSGLTYLKVGKAI